MKNILFATVFAACAALGLSSCMNGDYDANPDAALSGNNPLNPPGGGGGGGTNVGVAAKNEIRCLLNGSVLIVTGAKWQDIAGLRLFSGRKAITNGEQVIAFALTNYTGVGTYALSETLVSTGRYTLTDYTANPMMKDYWSDAPGAGGEVIVTSDANDEMKGTFAFTAIYNTEKVTLANGSFYVTK